ncbi:MAG TPA: ATP-binding protein, partial [Bacteroidota bacterium]|nr:ATP-binding protein [Bacteroidota bacterium]
GTEHLREEGSVIGRPLEEITPFPSLRHELASVMTRLFERNQDEYVHELTIGAGSRERVFQLAVTPLAVEQSVTGLVFTWTDITESKRTEAEIKRRNEELLSLNAIASSINKSLDPKDVLAVASEQLRARVQADVVLCYLRTERQDMLHLAAHEGIHESHAEQIRVLPLEGSVAGRVVTERRAMLVSRPLSEDPRVTEKAKAVFEEAGVLSFVGIPLESQDRVLGALVAAYKKEHAFSDQEQRFLDLVGNQVGSALANVELYSEVQSQVRRITLLYEIGRGLTGALDTKSIFSVVREGLKRALPFESFFYLTSAGPSGGLEPFARAEPDLPGITLSPDDPGVLSAGAGEPFAGQRKGGGSLIAVPLRSKGTVTGVFALAQEAPNLASQAHLRLLESIANLTEIAMDRAALYEDTVAKSEEIEARNRELDDFTYVVSHDLKEPLITIEGYSKIVLSDYRDLIDDEGKSYLNSLVQSSQRMKSLIDDLLTLSRLGRLSEAQDTVPLGEVITEVLHDFEFTLRNSSASVRVQPDLPSVRYNRTQLGMVFRNLIANAIKFNRSPEPLVEITVARGEGEYTVAVRDNGIGIEQGHFDRIFVVFQRLHRTEDFRGTGAGLTIVKKIVENHHGRVWLESVVGQGTIFYFTIPETSNG